MVVARGDLCDAGIDVTVFTGIFLYFDLDTLSHESNRHAASLPSCLGARRVSVVDGIIQGPTQGSVLLRIAKI